MKPVRPIFVPALLGCLLSLSCSRAPEPEEMPAPEAAPVPVAAVSQPEPPLPPPPPPDPVKQLAATTGVRHTAEEIEAMAAPGKQPISEAPYRGCIAVDADTGTVLVEQQADRLCIPASMTKLMTLLLVQEAVEAGKVTLQDTVAVSERAYSMGGSQVYLDPRESFPLEELLYALMIQSANDAAVAIAEHVFGTCEALVIRMNRRAAELGMVNTKFATVHGLSGSKDAADVTTPRDMAILSAELSKHPDIFRYTGESFRLFRPNAPQPFEMRTHNPLLKEKLPGCDGLKTGYTRRAGYSISVSVKRGGHRIIIVQMGSPDKTSRDTALKTVLSQAFAALP